MLWIDSWLQVENEINYGKDRGPDGSHNQNGFGLNDDLDWSLDGDALPFSASQ